MLFDYRAAAPKIGNDIVDLNDPEARGKARDRRFVERVFTPSEQRRIDAAGDPDRMLWALWAAKETAFKILQKSHPQAAFAQRKFRVEPARDFDGRGGVGRVRYTADASTKGPTIFLRWDPADDYVHCLGADNAHALDADLATYGVERLAGDAWERRHLLHRLEFASAGSPASVQGRLLAKTLIRARLALPDVASVAIVRDWGVDRMTPPRATLTADGGPLPVDISLSHHGQFVSAAVF